MSTRERPIGQARGAPDRAWIAAVLGFLLCLALGFLCGGWADRALSPPTAASEPAPRGPAPRAASIDPGGSCEHRVAALEQAVDGLDAQVAFDASQLRALQEEAYGTPLPWPDDVPRKDREDFEGNVRRALADCGVAADLVGVDCAEPPCLAQIRVDAGFFDFYDSFVNECPGWVDEYSSSVAMASTEADCGDGRKEQVMVLGASWFAPPPEQQENANKRFQARIAETKANWRCAPPP